MLLRDSEEFSADPLCSSLTIGASRSVNTALDAEGRGSIRGHHPKIWLGDAPPDTPAQSRHLPCGGWPAVLRPGPAAEPVRCGHGQHFGEGAEPRPALPQLANGLSVSSMAAGAPTSLQPKHHRSLEQSGFSKVARKDFRLDGGSFRAESFDRPTNPLVENSCACSLTALRKRRPE